MFVVVLGKASIKVCDFASFRSLSLASVLLSTLLCCVRSIFTRFYCKFSGPIVIIGLIVLCSIGRSGFDIKLLLACT